MYNILVGISMSKQSPTIFQYALRLAQQFEAKLTVAYILYERVEDLTKPRSDRAKAFEKYRLEKEREIRQFIRQQQKNQERPIAINPIVKYGGTYTELCFLAEQESADLMIVGKLNKPSSSLLKDLSHRLVTDAPCPLLVVPPDMQYQAINKMVYASNLQLEDCAAILKLKYWMDIFDAKLTCLHVCRTSEEQVRADRKIDILTQLFPQGNIEFQILKADMGRALENYISSSNANLIASMQRERKLWGGFFKRSFTEAIAGNAAYPVLIFQEQNL